METSKTIYLVDDDEDDYEFMRDALLDVVKDARIVWVQNPLNLIDTLNRDHLDGEAKLLLLDINMPRLNGFELLAMIKQDQRHRHIPIVMVSTTTNQHQVNKAYYMGANAFIVKPVTLEDYRDLARGVGLCFLNSCGWTDTPTKVAKPKAKSIVVIEDNDDYWFLINIALKTCMDEYNIIRIADMTRMIHFLNHEMEKVNPPVDLILVDLYLPDREQGLELIRQIRNSPRGGRLSNTPVIVFSYSDSARDKHDSYTNQASAYLVKPEDLSTWSFYFENILHFWSDTVRAPQLPR